jgi:hypothetical protein
MTKRPLRIGFDLDGVILYNPVRIFRPIAGFISPLIYPKKKSRFYVPHSKVEELFWKLLHKTSFIPSSGILHIKELVKKGHIEAYIITGRYKILESDFLSWMKKIEADSFLKAFYLNEKNKQPHLYKEDMIKKLNLDIYVEDNWGIVKHISKNSNTKILWIYNILDRSIPYPFKFPSLKHAMQHVVKNHL